MSEASKVIPLKKPEASDDSRLLVTLTVGELRHLIRVELAAGEIKAAGPDRWVDIKEAAALMNLETGWIYHNLKRLPFVKKVGRKLLRFSTRGIQKWMESNGR